MIPPQFDKGAVDISDIPIGIGQGDGEYELFVETMPTLLGRSFVVATVVSTSGSTPQKPGARMAVLEDGGLRGTIGGGAIEQQVVEAAQALLSKNPSPTREEIVDAISGNICRCTGYQAIVDAVLSVTRKETA